VPVFSGEIRIEREHRAEITCCEELQKEAFQGSVSVLHLISLR
jgi:hypothetical protein